MALSKTMSTETNTGKVTYNKLHSLIMDWQNNDSPYIDFLDGKLLIQTELVLITTDRNLRVKALSRNLAVSGLHEFLHWAQGCNS